jgi:hypothetical protein
MYIKLSIVCMNQSFTDVKIEIMNFYLSIYYITCFDQRAMFLSIYTFWRSWSHIIKKNNDRLISLIDILTLLIDILTSLFEYLDIILRIHWHSLIGSERKVARRFVILHARCTRNALKVLQYTSFLDLLSWSNAFDFYNHDSNRAIFDLDYQVWNESFLKLFRFWCSSRASTKKISKLSVNKLFARVFAFVYT